MTSTKVVGISILIKFLTDQPVSFAEIAKSFYFLGPTRYNYWFITSYIILLMLQPVLSIVVRALDQKRYILFIIVLLFISTEIVHGFPLGYKYGGFSVNWFVTLFFIAGYIRKFGLGKRHTDTRFWCITFVLLVLAFTVLFIPQLGFVARSYNSWITTALAVAAFMLFMNIKVSTTKVSFFSKHMLSAYIIHQNIYIIPIITVIFAKLLPPPDSWLLYPYIVLSACVILACYIIIDKVRSLIFEHLKIDYAIQLYMIK